MWMKLLGIPTFPRGSPRLGRRRHIGTFGCDGGSDRSYKEQISEYQWKLSWGTQPSSDVRPILQRADVWISEEKPFGDFLGRHNHHLHGLQNSRTTSNDPHNSWLIACEDNHRWQQAGPQPWVIIKPQQATTTIDHHYSYPYVGKNPDNNKQSS